MERDSVKADELAALVAQAQHGDRGAMAHLIEQHQASLHRFVLFLGGDPSLANDVCQDTFLYLLEHLADLENAGAIGGWLRTIAKNKFLDHKKSPRYQGHADPAILDTMAHAIGSERVEAARALTVALASLDTDDRALILLADLEGYTAKEASGIIGISEAAGVSRLRRARARLQDSLADKKPQAESPKHQKDVAK